MYCTNYIHDTLMEPIRDVKSPSEEFKNVVGEITREMYRVIQKNNRYFGMQHAFKIVQKANMYGIDYKYSQFITLLSDFPTMRDDMMHHIDILLKGRCGMMKTLRFWYMEKFLQLHQALPEVHQMHSSKLHPDEQLRMKLEEMNDNELYC